MGRPTRNASYVRKNFRCFKCDIVVKGSVSCLFTHFRHKHNMKTSRFQQCKLICGQNNCLISCHKFDEYRNHLLRCTSFGNSTCEIPNDDLELPEFGLICNIFVHHGNPFFVISSMITAHFDSHFHSFEVWLPEVETKVMKGLCELEECEPLWLLENFTKSSSSFVCPRHMI